VAVEHSPKSENVPWRYALTAESEASNSLQYSTVHRSEHNPASAHFASTVAALCRKPLAWKYRSGRVYSHCTVERVHGFLQGFLGMSEESNRIRSCFRLERNPDVTAVRYTSTAKSSHRLAQPTRILYSRDKEEQDGGRAVSETCTVAYLRALFFTASPDGALDHHF
jgi:hypothetical protein